MIPNVKLNDDADSFQEEHPLWLINGRAVALDEVKEGI